MKKCCFAALLVLSIILITGILITGCSGPDTEGKTYTITYYDNESTGGFPPVDTKRYTSGEEAIVKDKNTLYKTGYEFLNWNTKKEGDGVAYQPGKTITVNNINIFLYAIWGKLPQ